MIKNHLVSNWYLDNYKKVVYKLSGGSLHNCKFIELIASEYPAH
jgi:hypothetical protein